MPNYCRILLLAIATVCLGGCSAPPPGVSGTVKINGTPVAAGQVRFIPQDGKREEFSTTIQEGAFDVRRNDIGGDYKVIVEVSFADNSSAADFYANLESSQPPVDGGPPVKTNEDKEKPKPHEFQEQLTNGVNTLDYDLNE